MKWTPNEIFSLWLGKEEKVGEKKGNKVVGNQSRKGIRERKGVLGRREES